MREIMGILMGLLGVFALVLIPVYVMPRAGDDKDLRMLGYFFAIIMGFVAALSFAFAGLFLGLWG